MHKMDPRAKFVLTTAFIVIVFFAENAIGYGLLIGFVCLCALLAKLPAGILLKSLRPLRIILIFTFVMNLLFTQAGETLWRWWIINITDAGLRQAIQMALRLILLITGTSILMLTTSPIDLTDGLESLLSPLKVFKFPAHELAMMMTIALRFIPTLIEETDKIMKAQMARGAEFETGSLLKSAQKLIPLLVPLFVSAFRCAEELAMAMESRCYHGGEGRTRMKIQKLAMRDAYATLIIIVFSAAAIIWGR